MERRLRPAAINTKLVVILIILVVIAGVIWIVRLSGESTVPIEGPFTLWCPECKEEFTFATREEARGLPTQVGEDGEKLVECPKCKKFVARWGGQARPKPKGTGDAQILHP
jgi:hypothetical protein